jgi:hypothetical protein
MVGKIKPFKITDLSSSKEVAVTENSCLGTFFGLNLNAGSDAR